MKIKTKLQLSTAIFACISGIVFFIIFEASVRVSHEIKKTSLLHELSNQVSALNMLSEDYLLHPSERDIVQWQSVYHSLEELLQGMKNSHAEASDIDPLIHIHEDAVTLFSQLQGAYDMHTSDLPQMHDGIATLGGMLLHKLQRMAEEVQRLQYASEAEIVETQKRVSMVSVLLLAAMMLGAIAFIFFLYKTIGKSLNDLYKGTRLISAGNLDYALEAERTDEIGLLARAFNEMRENLAHSYAELRREIEERRSIEDALRKQGLQFRRLVETMNEGLATLNATGQITYVNDRFCEMCGYPRLELIGRPFSCLFDSNLKDICGEEAARQNTGLLACYAVDLLSSEGRIIPAMISRTPIFDEEGNYAGSISTVTDITILKKAEEALRQSEQKYRMIFQNSPLGILHFDQNGTVTAFNESFRNLVGDSAEELIGLHLTAEQMDPAIRSVVTRCLEGRTAQCEGRHTLAKAAPPLFLKADFSPILSEGGRVLGGIGIIEDITVRKEAQDALRESEKRLRILSAQLLAAQEEERKRIARELHDSIGSLLSTIKFSLEKIHSQLLPGEQIAECIKGSISLTQNAIDESRRIMTDLRPSMLDDLGLIATLNWFCRQFQAVYSKIHIEQEIGIEEDEIAQPLKIVIFRIVQEALHNISKHSKAEWVNLSLLKSEGTIDLAIEDDGIGFEPESIRLSCDRGGGRGICGMRERAELSGGCFFMESIAGEGTNIRVSWPMKERQVMPKRDRK